MPGFDGNPLHYCNYLCDTEMESKFCYLNISYLLHKTVLGEFFSFFLVPAEIAPLVILMMQVGFLAIFSQ